MKTLRTPSSPAWRRVNGSVAVEFAVVLVAFLVPMTLGVYYFGRVVFEYNALQHASYAGARYMANAGQMITSVETRNNTDDLVKLLARDAGTAWPFDAASKCQHSPACGPASTPPAPTPQVVGVDISLRADESDWAGDLEWLGTARTFHPSSVAPHTSYAY